MGHSHHHHHDHSEGNIKVAFFLNLGFSIIEVIGGLWTNSIAILSDALHDLGDSLTLGVSWYFSKVAKRDKDQAFSYGYRRFSVLGALLSSIVLITGSVFILIEAIPRFLNPVNPDTKGMIFLAIGGLVVNGLAAFRISKGKTINEKVVYTHLLEDVLGWAATLIGALVMHFYDFPVIDPLLSVIISAYILFNVVKNLRESFKIILQGTPSSIDLDRIHEAVLDHPKVQSFHDCHAWTMDGNYNVLSIHLVLDEGLQMKELEEIKTATKSRLKDLSIDHVTIEFEAADEKCEPC